MSMSKDPTTVYGAGRPWRVPGATSLARIVHERFCCNCGFEARNHLEVSDSRGKIYRMALDLVSAVAPRQHAESKAKDLSAAS